jgi:DNA-binding PadR family transcriptional regulator
MSPREPAELLPLPHMTFHVLLALAEGDAHGWEIIRRIRALTEGTSDPSSGSLYLAMMRLEDQGLLEEADGPADADQRRRYYRITPFGRRVLAAESERLASLVARARRLHVFSTPGGKAKK